MNPKPRSNPPIALAAKPLAAGAYTQLGVASAPAVAAPGQNVGVGIPVTNLHSTPIYIAVTATYDGTEFAMYPDWAEVQPGIPHNFGGAFVMPSKSITVHLYSFYWTGSDWVQDDHISFIINLEAAKPVFSNLSASYRRMP